MASKTLHRRLVDGTTIMTLRPLLLTGLVVIGCCPGNDPSTFSDLTLCESGIRNQSTGECLEYHRVEFLMLREGLCRSASLQGDQVLSIEPIECPQDELRGYLR